MNSKTIAVVTGVASGIGKCIAENLCKDGVEVFGLDKNNVDIDKINFYLCDLSNENEVMDCVRKISIFTEKVDYLINVAGIFCSTDKYFIEELPLYEWEKVFDFNLKSVFLLSKHIIPLLKKSKNGNIINFSSEQVVLPQEKSAPYAITKAAIEMLGRIMAMELLADKVRVNTIALASVRTHFLKSYIKNDKKIAEMMLKSEQKMPFGIIETDDVYDLVKYLVSSNNKMTGQTVLMDSGVILDVNRKVKRGDNRV